jgi:hypothetical protein
MEILEWKRVQKLGEECSNSQNLDTPSDQDLTSMDMSQDGKYLVVGDYGGRIILFENELDKLKKGSPKKIPENKINFKYEYQSMSSDYDICRSKDLPGAVQDLKILNTYNSTYAHYSDFFQSINILSASYRNIYVEKIYPKIKKEWDMASSPSKDLKIPRLSRIMYDISHKTKKVLPVVHEIKINSISKNPINFENFISADKLNIYFWNLNSENKVFNPVNLGNSKEYEICIMKEKINFAKFSNLNCSIFAYGTNLGGINLCDLRISSQFENKQSYFNIDDINIRFTSNYSVNDLCFLDENSFATRHLHCVNIWDQRVNNRPKERILLYEPIIKAYNEDPNYINTKNKLKISSSRDGKLIATGNYNNMLQVIDLNNRINCQLYVDYTDEPKNLSLNSQYEDRKIYRKFNSKGKCFYRPDEWNSNKLNFNKVMNFVNFSPVENKIISGCHNALYEFRGIPIKATES